MPGQARDLVHHAAERLRSIPGVGKVYVRLDAHSAHLWVLLDNERYDPELIERLYEVHYALRQQLSCLSVNFDYLPRALVEPGHFLPEDAREAGT